MRLDDLVVIGLLLGVLALDVLRGAPGFTLPVVATAIATLAWLGIGRRRPPEALSHAPPRPAVLIRARDDAATIGAVVTGARMHGVPVLVVDDGSRDATSDIAERAGARVLRHALPRGAGAALVSGLRLAARFGHSHVVCLAGDGGDEPADVAAFLAALRGAPHAVHVAEGVQPDHGSRLAQAALRFETGWPVRGTAGPCAWPVAPILALFRLGPAEALETELLVRAAWAGVPPRPVVCRGRTRPVRPTALAPRLWTHALLVAERIFWPPRWFRRVRMPPARMASPRGWARRLGLLRARLVRLLTRVDLPIPHEGGENLVRAFDDARGAVLLTAAIGDPDHIPRPRGAGKILHTLVIRSPSAPPEPVPAPGRRHLRVTPEEGYLALPALRALRAGEVLLVDGDRVVDDRVVTVGLLGARRDVPAGPWLLAALARVPVIVVAAVRDGGAWRVVAAPPIHCVFDESRPHDAQIEEWAQRYADRIDALARRFPTQHELDARVAAGPTGLLLAGEDADAGRRRGGVAGGATPPPQDQPPEPYG